MHRTADAQNRLHVKVGADYQYDAAGNMTYDAVGQYYSTIRRTASAAPADLPTPTMRRATGVEKSTGGSTPTGTLYWYMTPGIVAESDLSGTCNRNMCPSEASASPARTFLATRFRITSPTTSRQPISSRMHRAISRMNRTFIPGAASCNSSTATPITTNLPAKNEIQKPASIIL